LLEQVASNAWQRLWAKQSRESSVTIFSPANCSFHVSSLKSGTTVESGWSYEDEICEIVGAIL
jgi:hypothetical protein